ncbi:MAG: phosphotransferase family protein [Devosia sp.]
MLQPESADLAHYRALIISRLPHLVGAQFVTLAEGWDSVALEHDGLIFRFARHDGARERLRREVGLLNFLRPRITMPLPQPVLFDGDEPFTEHRKIPGDKLLADDYLMLGEGARNALATRMAQFYAELHQLPLARLQQAGAVAVDPWLSPQEILEKALPRLPRGYKGWARKVAAAYRKLSIQGDELVFGQFDGHGWNMAFDFATGTLNGVYDFGDAGFGSRHRDLSYSNWISADLTLRILERYEQLTGHRVDRDLVMLYTSALRLAELAEGFLPADVAVANVVNWADELKLLEETLRPAA